MTSLALGSMRIDLLPEIAHRMMPVSFLFNDLTAADMARNADWLGPDFLDPVGWQVGLAFQAYVIRAGGQVILVDSCNGNHKQRPTAPWQHDFRATSFLDNLAALGLRPEDVDIVLCTHLHCDHVGWNTRLDNGRWVPTFPNARHVFNKSEYDHYAARFAAEGAGVNHGAFADSVLPVVEAGMADFVTPDHLVLQGLAGEIRLAPSPGHSFGHVCIHATGGGQEAVVVGDVIHHPIQLDMPELKMRADLDPDLAISTRRRVLEHCAETGAWLLAGHIPHRSITQIVRVGTGYRFSPLP